MSNLRNKLTKVALDSNLVIEQTIDELNSIIENLKNKQTKLDIYGVFEYINQQNGQGNDLYKKLRLSINEIDNIIKNINQNLN